MIFENLADRLQETFKKLRGHGKLTADDVPIRLAPALKNASKSSIVFTRIFHRYLRIFFILM